MIFGTSSHTVELFPSKCIASVQRHCHWLESRKQIISTCTFRSGCSRYIYLRDGLLSLYHSE